MSNHQLSQQLICGTFINRVSIGVVSLLRFEIVINLDI